MTLDGTRIYFEGTGEVHEYDDKIRKIVNAIKSLSPSSEVSMRFLKSGNLYEGLLWGKDREVPIGIYNRGHSMAQLLDTIYRKVKKECTKALKTKATSKVMPFT